MTEASCDNTDSYKYCSFCGKKEKEVGVLVEGRPGIAICGACVQFASDFLSGKVEATEDLKLLKPLEIKEFLDEYVIAQDKAKKVLSVAVYNHFKRLNHQSDVELQKSNILLIGSSGTGKTLLAQTLAKILDVPFVITDATPITESGYVGEDVETMLQMLLIAADNDVAKAQKGIIYVDEIDKKARKSGANLSITRDVSGEGVQRALLKVVEGAIVNVHPQGERKHPGQQFIRLDTSDILFIFGGAFDGLTDVIAERCANKRVGFLGETKNAKNNSKLLNQITHRDLIKYGIIPELTGRIPVIAILDNLNIEDLCKILTEPKNALIRQYQELLKMDGTDLVFEDKALKAIAQKAIDTGTGARSLRSVMENIMNDIMFNIPSKPIEKCVITEELASKKEK